jgi:hypothetical protein
VECSVDGCEAKAVARGWCPKHWWRWRHHGTTDIYSAQDLSAEQRFWAKVDRAGDCWLWTASRRGDGYGAFQVESQRQISAHRYSYLLNHGPIPEGMVVMHSCDQPLCVNPDHLSLGTNLANQRDAARKGRKRPGIKNHNAKLSEEQVLELRARYEAGGISQKDLAAEYGISHALVSFIVTRKAWKHI